MTELKRRYIKVTTAIRVSVAALFLYKGYRILGATRDHAWDRARVDASTAIMDKVIETTGILDPRNKDKAGVQAHLEGGPYDATTRFVDACGAIGIIPEHPVDARQHIYRLTDRKFGQQTVFSYRGFQVPTPRASQLDAVA